MSRTTTTTKDVLQYPIEQWIAWVIGATTIAVTITIFMYVNFTTKFDFEEYKRTDLRYEDALEKRLDRIENKLDQLLTNSKE